MRHFKLRVFFFPFFVGEEPKKRKSKWDVSVVPAAASVKTATPPTRVGGLGPSVVAAVDLTSAAKKPKIVS